MAFFGIGGKNCDTGQNVNVQCEYSKHKMDVSCPISFFFFLSFKNIGWNCFFLPERMIRKL